MSTDATTRRSPPNILVVDDLPSNLDLLTSILIKRGYEPRPFPSGRLALAAARAEPPDLALLDVNIPDLGGFEICRQLKADPVLKEIPVIFITVHAGMEEKVKAFAAGAVDYVTKPFQPEEIEARVAAHLKIRSLQQQLAAENDRLEQLVAERTRQLAKSYERQVELGRLKNDFLRMIAHEIRTPVHGVLGMGERLLEMLPNTEQAAIYRDGFTESSARLRELIEDATLLTEFQDLSWESNQSLEVAALMEQVRHALLKLQIGFERMPEVDRARVNGTPRLLQKAVKTLFELAAIFSANRHLLNVLGRDEGKFVALHVEMDDLRLSAEQVAELFKVESPTRFRSRAAELGLGPVVSQRIITAFGGSVTFAKGEGSQGDLVITLNKSKAASPGNGRSSSTP